MDGYHILQVIMLVTVLHAQLARAASRKTPADFGTIREEAPSHLATPFAYAIPILLTFQGTVLDGNSQLAEPVVVHVLVKAKILKTGSYIVRAVVNTQRTVLQSRIDNTRSVYAHSVITVLSITRCLQVMKVLHPGLAKLHCFWSVNRTTTPMSHRVGLRCSSRCWVCWTLR